MTNLRLSVSRSESEKTHNNEEAKHTRTKTFADLDFVPSNSSDLVQVMAEHLNEVYEAKEFCEPQISRQMQACIDEYDTYYALAHQRVATEEKLLESCTAHKLRPHRSKSCHQQLHLQEDKCKGYTQILAVKPMVKAAVTPSLGPASASTSNFSINNPSDSSPKTPVKPSFMHKPVLGRVSARSIVRTRTPSSELEQQQEYNEINRLRLNSEVSAKIEARAVMDSPIISPKPYPYLTPELPKNPRRIVSSRASNERFGKSPFGSNSDISSSSAIQPGLSPVHVRRSSLTSRESPSSNKMVTPVRIYKGSFRESMTPTVDRSVVFPSTLTPVGSPKVTIAEALEKLRAADTNWETIVDGFRLLVRLTRHHTETVRTQLHVVNMLALKQLANLRSQVTRAACQFYAEMFAHIGKSMEPDLEKICEKLLDKSADTNKFIREDANAALEAMVENLSVPKTLTALEIGLKHRHPVARAATAKMVSLIVRKTNVHRCMGELAHKLLPMLAKLLQEGSLDARTHAKTAVAMLVTHSTFQAQLKSLLSEEDLRKVAKSISSIKNEVQYERRM